MLDESAWIAYLHSKNVERLCIWCPWILFWASGSSIGRQQRIINSIPLLCMEKYTWHFEYIAHSCGLFYKNPVCDHRNSHSSVSEYLGETSVRPVSSLLPPNMWQDITRSHNDQVHVDSMRYEASVSSMNLFYDTYMLSYFQALITAWCEMVILCTFT